MGEILQYLSFCINTNLKLPSGGFFLSWILLSSSFWLGRILSNNKLYVTQADVLSRLQIGKFAFEPQANGNMSLLYTG